MLFVSQLVLVRLIFLTQNPLVSSWTNGQDKSLLSVCFDNQIVIHKVYHVPLIFYVLIIDDSFFNL